MKFEQDKKMNSIPIQLMISYETLKSEVSKRIFVTSVISYIISDVFIIQSSTFFTDSLPLFLIKISTDLKFKAFHAGVRCHITSLSKNRITELNRWSRIEEAIRFLNALSMERKSQSLKNNLMSWPHRKLELRYTMKLLFYVLLNIFLYLDHVISELDLTTNYLV